MSEIKKELIESILHKNLDNLADGLSEYLDFECIQRPVNELVPRSGNTVYRNRASVKFSGLITGELLLLSSDKDLIKVAIKLLEEDSPEEEEMK